MSRFYLNLKTLEGVILSIIFEGIQSKIKETDKNNTFNEITSKIEMDTGAISTK